MAIDGDLIFFEVAALSHEFCSIQEQFSVYEDILQVYFSMLIDGANPCLHAHLDPQRMPLRELMVVTANQLLKIKRDELWGKYKLDLA